MLYDACSMKEYCLDVEGNECGFEKFASTPLFEFGTTCDPYCFCQPDIFLMLTTYSERGTTSAGQWQRA